MTASGKAARDGGTTAMASTPASANARRARVRLNGSTQNELPASACQPPTNARSDPHRNAPPAPTDEASEPYGTRTVTRRNEAGIVVVSLVLAWFCRLNSRSSSFRSSSAFPVLAAASKAFMVGP